MKNKEYAQAQIKEALGEVNRYYFWLSYGREPMNDDELILYYAMHGGAKAFAEKHRKEYE